MKAFVSNVDTPFGHTLSRLLSSTAVGSRADEGEEEEEPQADQPSGDTNSKKEKAAKDNYTIVGTLYHPENKIDKIHKPVQMIESGDKKKGSLVINIDAIRREAIERTAIPGKAPKCVTSIIKVSIKIYCYLER